MTRKRPAGGLAGKVMKDGSVEEATGLAPIGVRVTIKGMLFLAADASGLLPRRRGEVDMTAFERFVAELNRRGFMEHVIAQAMDEMERMEFIEKGGQTAPEKAAPE